MPTPHFKSVLAQRAALIVVGACLSFICVRYLTGAVLNYDDLGYAQNLPIVIGQRGYIRTLLMLLFNTDIGRVELRTYGLARAIQMATWSVFGKSALPIYLLILTAHAASAFLLVWALRRFIVDSTVRFLITVAWFASPFILPILHTEHHFLYIVVPFYVLIGWIGFVTNVIAKEKNFSQHQFYVGFALLIANFWLGESAIPSTIAAGLMLAWFFRDQKAISKSVLLQVASAIIALIFWVAFQKIFVADPTVSQRFKFSLPRDAADLEMRFGWIVFAVQEAWLAGFGFPFFDPELGRTSKVAGLTIVSTKTFWAVFVTMLLVLGALARPLRKELNVPIQKKIPIVTFLAILTASSFFPYFGNMLIGQGSTFAIRYTSICYTMLLIFIPAIVSVLSPGSIGSRYIAVVVAGLCLAATVTGTQRIEDIVNQPRRTLETRLLNARTQGKRAVLVIHEKLRVGSVARLTGASPGLISVFSYVTPNPFRSFWTTDMYLRVVLSFETVGTSFKEIDDQRVEIMNDFSPFVEHRIYKKSDVLIAGMDNQNDPTDQTRPLWFEDWASFIRWNSAQ